MAIGVVLVSVLGVAVGVIGFGRAPKATAPANTPAAEAARQPDRLEVEGVQLQDYDKAGKLRWRVKSSGKLDVDRDKLLVKARDISFEVMRAEMGTLLLEAPEVEIDYRGKRASLAKGVRATGSNKLSRESQTAVYDLASDRVRAQGPLKAHLGDYDLTAGALGFGRLANEADLVGGVRLVFKDLTVTADKAHVDLAKRTASLSGHLEAKRGTYTAAAGSVTVNAESDEARLAGGVSVRNDKVRARADSAVLRKSAQVAELDGSVEVEGSGFSTTGGHLVIDEGAGTATMSGGTRTKVKVRR